jgi:hypothetical protein
MGKMNPDDKEKEMQQIHEKEKLTSYWLLLLLK